MAKLILLQVKKLYVLLGNFKTIKDVADLVLRSNDHGDNIKLSDVSTIEESLVIPTTYYDSGGNPALNIIILKKTDGDIIDVVDEVKEYISKIPELYGSNVTTSTSQDF